MMSQQSAIKALKCHAENNLKYDVPSESTVRAILSRPFGSVRQIEDIVEADQAIYCSATDCPKTRRRVLLDVVINHPEIVFDFEGSCFTVIEDEALGEELGGIDSMVALAVLKGGAKAWLTFVNYYMYSGDNDAPVIATYAGKKILGPAMMIAARPANKFRPENSGSKFFPDAPANKLVWTDFRKGKQRLLEVAGVDADELQG